MTEPIRILLVSTPRSGNTWFRKLLSGLYGVPQHATHELTEADWNGLPAEFVHQIHWFPTETFLANAARHRCRVVTIARHPLDVLVSILHFSWYTPETGKWLLGAHGDESNLRGLSPRSQAFLEYASGPRAAALLGVTSAWWGRPGVTQVRYEDLVRDTSGELGRVEGEFGHARCRDLPALLGSHTLERLRPESLLNHYWQGRPGLWRELLPAAETAALLPAVTAHLGRYGYECNPDPSLTPLAADHNWSKVAGPPLLAAVQRKVEDRSVGSG